MKRENQKFYGVLRDKELYLIEDALNNYHDGNEPVAKKLILKLYKEFAELPPKHKIITTGNYSELGYKVD